jgi:uncharacterized protein YnzC (UPF0291/DUF896 family)
MLNPEVIARINELARKQRSEGLSAPEKEEQSRLRQLYLDFIKSQVKSGLDAAGGGVHPEDCGCGCHGGS